MGTHCDQNKEYRLLGCEPEDEGSTFLQHTMQFPSHYATLPNPNTIFIPFDILMQVREF